MKDKNSAGILALFLGWLGVHRFYLGQTGLGIAYFMFFWFPLTWLIAFIDGIIFLSMDQQKFDEKYNRKPLYYGNGRATDFERPAPSRETGRDERRERRQIDRLDERQRRDTTRPNPFKQSGLEKFKDFDYSGAIEDFKKSLQIEPKDIATHFNLACAYSLTEDAEMGFHHLSKAVGYGFRDFQKIKQHHALAYLRIQDGFDNFEENGFRLEQNPADNKDLLSTQPDLLDQLKKLGELREQGLLTETEFDEQKKKLLG